MQILAKRDGVTCIKDNFMEFGVYSYKTEAS